jgi:hypothetical protein
MKPIFMDDKEGHFLRIVKRKDETVLVTASSNAAKKSWEYSKEFNVDKFIIAMKAAGFVISD